MSYSSSDDDSQQRFALGFLFALIALLLTAVVGTVVVKQVRGAKAPAAVSAPGAAPAAQAAPVAGDAASVRVEGGVVKFFFATGKAELAAGANEALADVVKGVAAGKKAVVSGFHDATGDAAVNEELAKQRALAVRDALKALGVAEDKVELKKPEVTQASGTNAEARRVEVTLAD
ncbi:MAG: OmpA family protein [Acidovorax sp.]|uniref:OmpA family protein n=1 Tax=Acidovorax sp. TaxID=1872122 RepID=UPI0039E3856C